MRLSRFERKILLAIAVVALGSLLGALLLGSGAVGDAYRAGVNPRVRETLDQGLAARREHLLALRENTRRTADAVAHHHDLHLALADGDEEAVDRYFRRVLRRYPEVSGLSVRAAGLAPVAREREPDDVEARVRRIREIRGIEGLEEPAEVEVELTAPQAPFDAFQQAGEQTEIYKRLEAATDYVSGAYLWVYMALVSVMTLIAAILGAMLSRRVTRRVSALAAATKRVGKGDLQVSVPTRTDDEIGELTQAFNDMVRDLRESRARIDFLKRIGAWQEFARRLAHEIKNPLTPIQLAAQEMRRGYHGDDVQYQRKLEDAVSIIEEEVATLRRLVGEFSSFARLPTAKLEEADIGEFLADVERGIPGMMEDLEEKRLGPVEVSFSAPRARVRVQIDSMMLKRAVDNLVRNAAQAVAALRQEGGGRVVVEARVRGEELTLEIRDNGPGVAPEDVERIFDPYYTTKSDGTGLGLPIVKKVVLEHGGTVDASRAAEGGACLTIRLPLAP